MSPKGAGAKWQVEELCANSSGQSRLKVLQVVGRLDRGGTETLLVNLFRDLDRSRVEFGFVVFGRNSGDYEAEITKRGGEIHHIEGSRLGPLSRAWGLFRLLRTRRDYHFVHFHTHLSASYLLAAAFLAGVPERFVHSHSTQAGRKPGLSARFYERLAIWSINRFATRRVACGEVAAQYMFRGRKDVILLPNAINTRAFVEASRGKHRHDVASELGIAQEGIIILHVAGLKGVKNHALSLRIAQELHSHEFPFAMLIVGEGPERDSIAKAIGEMQLSREVFLLGQRTDVPRLLSAADVCLLPSFYEGVPLAIVESQAAGVPAVVSSAVPEEVDLGLGLVKFLDLRAPVQAWTKLLLDSAVQQPPSENSRLNRLLELAYDSQALARRYERLYVGASESL